jgi:hypothetical protein
MLPPQADAARAEIIGIKSPIRFALIFALIAAIPTDPPAS